VVVYNISNIDVDKMIPNEKALVDEQLTLAKELIDEIQYRHEEITIEKEAIAAEKEAMRQQNELFEKSLKDSLDRIEKLYTYSNKRS
jgi:hypothetical protein